MVSRRRRRRYHSNGNLVAQGAIAGSAGALMFALVTPFIIALVMLLAGGVTAGVVYASLAGELQTNLATLETLGQRQIFQSTKIYDRNGRLLNEVFAEGRRTRVRLSDVPVHMRQATIAVEDDTFYTNPGIDVAGILRSGWRILRYRQIMGGGSTITQQLVRHVAFSYKERISRSYTRKIKEALLALILTRQRSKDEILEYYLNEIYYGNLAYGVEAAAQTFFSKSAKDLTLAESAMLAGLPQAPLSLDPFTDLEAARKRQRTVLNLMVKNGFITQAEADAAFKEPLKLTPPKVNMLAPHFVVYVRQQLEQMFGPEMVSGGGLTVYTTLDLRFQQLAEKLAREHVAELREEHNLTNAALVALQPDTGQILAMLGSVDYRDDSIDGRVNVAIRERQPGSSIKPITYVTAFEQGITPAKVIWDVETEIPLDEEGNDIYRPQNYDGEFHGPVRLRDALANSFNIPAIKLLDEVGIANTLDTAHRMGIRGLQKPPEYYGLSLTLGGGEVTLLDLTTAYATLSNQGGYVPPQAILWVADSSGKVIYQYEPPKPKQVLDPRAVYLVTDILSDNEARTPEFGPNSALKVSQPAAAKTGTTNDFRDNWTLGYTPYLTVGVWAGNSDNSPMVHSSGLTGAGPLWHDFMEGVFKSPDLLSELREIVGPLPQTFERPEGIVEAEICKLSSLQEPTAECPEKRREIFIKPDKEENSAESQGSGEGEKQQNPWDEEGVVYQRAPSTRLPVEQVKALVDEIVTKEKEERDKRREELGTSEEDAAKEEEELVQDTTEPEKPAICPLPPGSAGPETLFLLPPKDEKEQAKVREWALRHGWPVLIENLCVGEGVALPGGEIINATWRIKSPSSGDVITTTVPIMGTANFSHDQILFYKVDWGRGEEPSEWITMGQTHKQPVIDNQLEVWHAEGLPPGEYSLRLVLVKTDGNELPAYKVTVTVERP